MVVTRQRIRDISTQLLNIPYKHLGRRREEGLDCYGLVLVFYEMLGLPLRPYVPPYDKLWYTTYNLIEENAIDFAPIVTPRAGCVMSAKIGTTKYPNHLMVCIDSSYVLNTDQYAGTYLFRWYAVRNKIAGCYERIGLQVIDSV